MKRLSAIVLLSLGLAAIIPAAAHPKHEHEVLKPAETVPDTSVYQLTATLTDQNGRQTPFSALRGTPTLVTMFYTSCKGICPVLATTLQRMELELAPEQRAGLRVVMISFDPARDTVAQLRTFAKSHDIDQTRWTLARTPESSVRDIAAVLGVRYRPLPDGSFSHSAIITLLDKDGVIRARTENLQQLDPAFMSALRGLLMHKP